MEITLVSARDLKTTGIFSKTKAYAVAWISNDPKNRQWTPMDKENGTNPTWNQVMTFVLDEAALQQGRLLLQIAIYADATFGDKEIGRVRIPLNELLKPTGSNKGASATKQFVSYQVRKPSGKAKGVLNLSVRFAEKVDFKPQQQPLQVVIGSYGAANEEPVTAFPAGLYGVTRAEAVTAYTGYPTAGSSSYKPANNQCPPPPYPPQAGYTPPPPPPYYQGYPPPCYPGYLPYQGYPAYQGYPPVVPSVQQPPRKNNKPGVGLATGLISGALGGLLLGDLIGGAI